MLSTPMAIHSFYSSSILPRFQSASLPSPLLASSSHSLGSFTNADACNGRITLCFQDFVPTICLEVGQTGGFRHAPSPISFEISQNQVWKHGICSSRVILFGVESMAQASFSYGCSLVSKVCVYPHQQRPNSLSVIAVGVRRRRRTNGHVAASVEVEQEIVEDRSGSEHVNQVPLPESSLSVKKTLKPLRLAPKPPMNKMFTEFPVKVEEKVDASSKATSRLESVHVASTAENVVPFQNPEVFPKERGRGKLVRKSQREEFLLWRSQLKHDEASRDLMSLISYVRFVLHAKHDVGERLEAEDESFLREKLLPYHPEKEEKLEKGVQFIKVDLHPEYQTRCFFIAQDDGSFLDFSFRKCILQFGQQTVGLDAAKRLLDLVFY